MISPVAMSGLSKRLAGRDILKNITLSLGEGRCIALVGHNGAGKTTMLKILLGLSSPTSGAVKVFGEDPARARMRGRIGFLPENVSFSPSLTGRELLAFYARLKGSRPSACLTLLDRVGLGEAASRPIRTYSKGMRQRLGLAQALIGAPRLLLLDEPTTGLDATIRQIFYEIVLELRNGGATILLSSHSLTELEERADRLIIMNKAAIVADGSLDELQESADLPVRMRIVTHAPIENPGGLGPVIEWRANGGTIELVCARKNKIEVLRAIIESHAPVADVAIMPSNLDQLYAHFLRGQGNA